MTDIIENLSVTDKTQTLLEIGETSYAGWADGSYTERTVTTNGTGGDITIVFTPKSNNWNSAGHNLLSVNGVKLISHGTAVGDYMLGSTNVNAKFTARKITITIKVSSGDATIVDSAGNSGTANVGAIGNTFTLKINQDKTNSWVLTSVVVTQVIKDNHICSYTSTISPATCIAPKLSVKTCTECGSSNSELLGPVLGHNWSPWIKISGVPTRRCITCGAIEHKAVTAIDTSKTFLALGDSLTFALNTPGTVNDSWAKKVADSLGMSNYLNKAVHGSEAYHWYSLLTGKAAPNGTTYTLNSLINDKKLAFDPNFNKSAMTTAIENAGVVAFTLGSNDMSDGYVQWRTPKQIHDTIIAIIDEIHRINSDAVIIAVGYAYGLITLLPVANFSKSYDHFVELDELLTETLNSDAYNSFVYYVDVSKTMSDYATQGNDKVHPTAAGHIEMANDVIAASKSIDAINSDITAFIIFNGKIVEINNGETATIPCRNKYVSEDIVVMGTCSIEYDGRNIATSPDGQIATLKCAKKIMATDVIIS